MADDDEEEDGKSKAEPFHSPHNHNSSQFLHHRSFSDSKIDSNDVVFPPINHEGLHNRPPTPFPEPITSSPPPVHGGGGGGDGCELARRCVGQLRDGVARAVLRVRNYCALRGEKWPFGCGSGVAAVILVWWFCAGVRRRRRRLRVGEESRDHLVLLIKEKDEKIKQLLHQIAQMNQLLLSLHKSSSSQGGVA